MIKTVLLLILMFLTSSATASRASTTSSITVGFSFAKPPYVMASQFEKIDINALENELQGIEIDILKAVFEGTNITFKPVFDTFLRIIQELDQGNLDAAETSGPRKHGIYYSAPLISCENFAITKQSFNIALQGIFDLKDKWIVAWQGASTDIGGDFLRIATGNPKYIENHDQEAQYKMFRAGRVDIIVIDRLIFEWWDAKYTKREKKRETYVYHAIFPQKNEYRIGFRSKEIRDLFDERLEKIRKSGVYDKIFQKYLTAMER